MARARRIQDSTAIVVIVACLGIWMWTMSKGASWTPFLEAAYFHELQSVTLNNGMEMPRLGLGTWRADLDKGVGAVLAAAELGYKHLDCADRYLNHREIGGALGTLGGMPPLFVTTKLWNTDHASARVRPAVERMLQELGLRVVDLLLMHWPLSVSRTCDNPDRTRTCEGEPDGTSIEETWLAMESIVDAGLARGIGVSNFGVRRLKSLLGSGIRIRPAVNQVELHPYLPQTDLVAYCREQGIALVAYSPIGSPGKAQLRVNSTLPPLIRHPLVLKAAATHGRTPSQVLLRWGLQRGVAVIPMSVNRRHIEENAQVWDWALTSAEMDAISNIHVDTGPVRYVAPSSKWLDRPSDIEHFWD